MGWPPSLAFNSEGGTCIKMCVNAGMHKDRCTDMHANVCTGRFKFMHLCMYEHMSVCLCLHISICMSVSMPICMPAPMPAHMSTSVHVSGMCIGMHVDMCIDI